MPKTLHLEASNSSHIELAAQLLIQGKLVAFPTETVYGLGALAYDENCVENIFKAKNRPSNNPLILHVGNRISAVDLFDFSGSKFEKQFSDRFELLSKFFWPGPLTLVGKKKAFISNTVTSGSPKVAVRFPSHPIALQLLRLVEQPIAAPSANLFTRPSPTSSQHVLLNLDSRIDAVINGGGTQFGIESTVIDIDCETPTILRHGAISLNDLLPLLPNLSANPIGASKDAENASPGLCAKHYSPKIGQIWLANEHELAKAWFSSSGIILRKNTESKLTDGLGKRPEAAGLLRVLPDDPQGCARELFSAFYDMESVGLQTLLVENLLSLAPSTDWAALGDRLLRASAKNPI